MGNSFHRRNIKIGLFGTLFAIGALAKFKALTLAPASVVFPVNKSNVLFVIIIGILFFSEAPSINQWAGIGTSILVLLLISSEQFKISGTVTLKGIFLAVFAALCTSLSMTAGKLASVNVDRNSDYTPNILYTGNTSCPKGPFTFLVLHLFLSHRLIPQPMGSNSD